EDRSVVMPDIDHHVESGSAMSSDRFVHRCAQRRNQRRELVTFLTRTEPHARAVSPWGHLGNEHVDTEIHPKTFEGLLYRRHDARLPRSPRAVPDDALTRLGRLRRCANTTGHRPPA